jgi:glucose-6-phosphate isomerase
VLTLVPSDLLSHFNPATGEIQGVEPVRRTLREMNGYFADESAYTAALAATDPLIYTVTAVAPAEGEGALHYAIGCVQPGRIGAEYYMTKGHFHAWRAAAEYYIGLSGRGVMLLEDESGTTSEMVTLTPNSALYVPGYVAHRTINTGSEPLTYLGIFPAGAGHDYGSIAERNFRNVVVAENGAPTLAPRATYLANLAR